MLSSEYRRPLIYLGLALLAMAVTYIPGRLLPATRHVPEVPCATTAKVCLRWSDASCFESRVNLCPAAGPEKLPPARVQPTPAAKQ